MLRSAIGRLALASAAAVMVATLGALAVVWVASAAFERRTFQDAIAADVASLVRVLERGGPLALARAVEARAAGDASGRSFWWLADGANRRVAGNLRAAPRAAGWQTIMVPARDDRPEARVLGFGADLPGGLFLFAAREASELDRLEASVTRALLASGGAAILFALGTGLLIARGIGRRAAAINQALAAVAAGDLSKRLPGAEQRDEFGRLAASVNATLDRLEAAMRALRRVSGDIAHDLRTPLSRLRHRLEAALTTAEHAPAWRAAVERGIADADEVLKIFAAILRIAEAESGARRAGFAKVALSEALADVVEAFQPEAEAGGRVLQAAISPEVIVEGDRDLLQQAASNLVANALRHTPPGTRVQVSLARQGDRVAIEVADDGAGVAAPDRARLGTPFLRLDTARAGEGHGLGLALVQAVAELHGGVLEFSDAAPGLRARLALPAG